MKMMTFCLFLLQCNIIKKDNEVTTQIGENKHQDNRIIIYHEAEINLSGLRNVISQYGGKIIYEYKNFNALAVEIPQNKSIDQSIEFFSKQKEVLNVSADGVNAIQK